MRRKKEEATVDEMNATMARAAAAQEEIAKAQREHNEHRPDLRIHSLAYAVQSFSGREASNDEIAARAQVFLFFLMGGEIA